MDSVCAVVLCHDSLPLVRRSVGSLLESAYDRLHVVVVDNGSREDPTDDLLDLDHRITVVRNPGNLGVAGGRNAGLRHALERGDDYVLFFDDDAVAAPDMVSHLVASARDRDADVTGPVITYTDDPSTIWRAGNLDWKLYYLSAVPEIVERVTRILGVYPVKTLDLSRGKDWPLDDAPKRDEVVDFVIGCCQLVRRSIVEQVGLLDETFHPYGGEDIDFCERVRRAGGRILLSCKARASHDRPSSVSDPEFRTEVNNAHMMLLAAKHLGAARYLASYLPDLLLLQCPLKLALYGASADAERTRGLVRGLGRGAGLSMRAWAKRLGTNG
jgi:hypothetical protein